MSVFGGDSWGREAHHRKRKVNDLLLDATGAGDSSSYRKLPSGKYACLICPHNPVLDTPLMLSMHMKSNRHVAVEEKRQNEMNKRRAVPLDSTSITKTCNNRANKPLIEKTRKAAYEILHHRSPEQIRANNSKSKGVYGVYESASCDLNNLTSVQMDRKDVVQLPLDYRERREKELKFTAAGWKRDCHGGWFRDENVEFDSDEEDPNVSLTIGER